MGGKDKGMGPPEGVKMAAGSHKTRFLAAFNGGFSIHQKNLPEPNLQLFLSIEVHMQVTEALVDKLAHLSKLRFDEAEKAEIRADLDKMIGFVDQLNAVDTSGVEPLMHMSAELNRLRDDVPGGSMDRKLALSQAPEAKQSFFTVPKVIHK